MRRYRLRRVIPLAALGLLFAIGATALMPGASIEERPDPVITSATGLKADSPDNAAISPAYHSELLKSGLDALTEGDIGNALVLRNALPAASLDRHVLTWAIASSGGRLTPSGEIAAAARTLSGWPGMAALRANSEQALARENPDPQTVVQAFGGSAPQTSAGRIVLSRALAALGQEDAARAILLPMWRDEKLDAQSEIAILKAFGAVIPPADHRIRMERMLYSDRIASAGRVAGLAGASALFDAWSAVIRGNNTASALLDAVPPAQRSAGYQFAKARFLRRSGKFAEAAAIMEAAPKDAITLIDADAWWIERRALARELADMGDMKGAYRVAAAHAAESPVNQADAEFHAGWYALRGLGDAALAARHFARIAEIADGPISLSRANYWLGRAAKAGGPGDARLYFERAAAYGMTFYGQLAAERIGRHTIAVGAPVPTDADRANFSRREAVHAVRRLESFGHDDLAVTLTLGLAGQIASPGELSLLADMAQQRGNHYLALKVGKIASSRGIDIGVLAHPIGVIPASADLSASGEALAYAIARQESEFNISAVSSAGARGLLQLLPATARDTARKVGLTYSPTRLTTDAGYNATLGAAFLGQQLARFDGSYVLTFAAYNAGPRRAQEWIARYGDPRGKDIDAVVDWIERIPYGETRGYVQRVMENYQVYKMRLTGRFDIAADLTQGRR